MCYAMNQCIQHPAQLIHEVVSYNKFVMKSAMQYKSVVKSASFITCEIFQTITVNDPLVN